MKWLICGQYACRIIADSDISRFVPEHWENHSHEVQAFSEEVTIRFEKKDFKNLESMSDGWMGRSNQGCWQGTYTFKGRQFFTIESEAPNEVRVCIGKISEMHVRLGIQYGMMAALNKKCIGLHGVTLLCGHEVIILSAPSGTGKTTLAKLLEKYADAIVINGDFALLAPGKNEVLFEPTPFCGTSGRALNHRLQVNRIVFLGQAKENCWRKLEAREAMKQFMSNTFIPDWDSDMQQAVQGNILKCIDAVKLNAYDFAPTQEAAEVFFEQVESYSSRK